MTEETFIIAKSGSKYNFSWWQAPIIGFFLLLLGEVLGALIFVTPLIVLGIEFGPWGTLLLELTLFALIAVIVIFWARKVEKAPWLGLGFTKRYALRDFLIGWGLGASMLSFCVFLMVIVKGVNVEGVQFSFDLFWHFIPLTLAWSIQGTTEEILCRGWLFSSIAVKNKVPLAILVSSLFFAAIHLGNDGINLIPLLDLFLFGVLAALVMLKTKNIWVISGLHAAWNCFQGNVFAFKVSGSDTGAAFIKVSQQGPDWLSGGSFGVEGSVISLLVQGIIIGWLVYELFIKKCLT
ncbi:CPBP family intramembrane glutamic endopeptidase [Streptococcus catagoni]|uniref:CPBP family intramembrane glutamic endopeptidase n=1 Tax=Streptococcus catagoni TaxID=2654874 RepID=UPI0014072D07|nr:type II CAAX endopeptidase family protein [Streptococcus catagoni]